MRVRALTWNVHGFRAGMEQVAKVIAAERPDLVLLQESRSRRRLRRLAKRLGMRWVVSHSWRNLIRNAVLFTPDWRLASVEVHLFPKFGRMRRRGMTVARLRKLGVPLTAISTHFGLGPRERSVHAPQVTDYLAGVSGAVVVGVDLNEEPQASAARWISERLFDAFGTAGVGDGLTFPASAPTARIDYLFMRNVPVTRAWVSSAPNAAVASDHRAVVADLELPED